MLGRVDVEPAELLVEAQLEVIGEPERHRQRDLSALARPSALEIDVAADITVERDAGQQARRGALQREDEAIAGQGGRARAGPQALPRVADPHEGVPAGVEAEPRRDDLLQQVALEVGRVLADQVGAEAAQQPRLWPPRVARLEVAASIADLRHEAVVGAEVVADVAVLGAEIEAARAARPGDLARAVGEVSAVPLFGEVRVVRGLAVAPQQLAGDDVLVVRAPLEVGSEHAVPRPPSRSRSESRRLTKLWPKSRRTRPIPTNDLSSWSAKLEPSGPGITTWPPPRSSATSPVKLRAPHLPVPRPPRRGDVIVRV